MSNQLAVLNIDEIRKGEIALRDVDPKEPKFQQLVESIKQNGIINPISVCPVTNAETNEQYYVIIDGLHRFTAATQAGLTEVPVNIIDADEGKILALQFQGNMMRVETKPAQFGKHIRRIMLLDPETKLTTLAEKFCVSVSYIMQRLQLTSLLDEIQKAVDSDQIPLNSAIALSKLPAQEQPEWLERAMTMESATFVEQATARAKSIREAVRAGRNPEEETFKAIPRMRRISEIQEELNSGIVASSFGDKSEAFLAGVRWSASLDDNTVKQKRAAFDAQQAQKKEKAKIRKEELAKKKFEKSEKEAEELRKQIESGIES